MRRLLYLLPLLLLASCEKEIKDFDESGNVTVIFQTSNSDVTRATVTIGDYFQKLNVMFFDADGNKVFDKVRTQYSSDANFGKMNLQLSPGVYTIVAVGHSSVKSATIKSPEMVQFTASEGEKLTDTFCYCGEVTVTEEAQSHDLTMNRVTAMFQMKLTDEDIPAALAKMKFDYTGGSANFNPSTSFGTTKSTQSENRNVSSNDVYQIYTFPYQAESCNLKVTVSALDNEGNVIRQRTFESVPVTRNRITTYTGHFFEEGDGNITQSGFGFTVNADWDGEDTHTFAPKR